MGKGILYLSNEDVKRLLDLGKAVEIVEQALREHSEGRVGWSTPEDLAVKRNSGWQYWVTGCSLENETVAGFRFRAIKPEGGSRDPSQAPKGPRRILILSDCRGGEVVAIMDEDWCHSVRTGAAATVACKKLARDDAAILAMLGAGDTARATLPVMTRAFSLKEVRVLSRRRESRESYARDLSRELELPIRPVDSAREALQGAHVVISATTTRAPFILPEWLERGSFLYSIGKHQELETAGYRGLDKFIVDSWEHCKKKSDIQKMLAEGALLKDDVYAELPQILGGQKPGRETGQERIFMRAIGLVNQDIALAAWVYHRALLEGVGTSLPY